MHVPFHKLLILFFNSNIMAGAGSYNKHNVMISYNSANKETVFKIRDYLNQNGVTFWIDVEHMAGSTLDAMSEAVENCTVFLMCYSAKYSQSENCKSGNLGK